MVKRGLKVFAFAAILAGAAGAARADVEYEVGGPLAGVKLPLFPTQHGEPPGHPGCIPILAEKAARDKPEVAANPLSAPFTTVGLYPELELYPGSVEHWREDMKKYMPIRSLFDRQSQIKNWVAPNIPGAAKEQVTEYAEPVWWVPRWGDHVATGYRNKPVPVVRLGVGAPPFRLDCGTLPAGVYVLRMIAAVPRENITYFRKPLFVRMTVNDGPAGEVSTYLQRAGYTDDFYSMSEMFFIAPAERRYEATLAVAEGSEVELLVHNVSLDDSLAGCDRRAIKTRPTLLPDRAAAALAKTKANSDLPREERLRRDEWLWRSFPRPNAQGSRPYQFPKTVVEGAPGPDNTALDPAAIAKEYGAWRHLLYRGGNQPFQATPPDIGVFLVNDKLKIQYTLDDFAHHRPLPDPYPYKDNGAALTYPNPNDTTAGRWWSPIANIVSDLFWYYPEALHQSVDRWEKTGEERYARDAAVALARWAYAFPALDAGASYLDYLLSEYNCVGRDGRFHRRLQTSRFYRWYTMYATQELDDYDLLFNYIKDNQDLADSIGRFVPWVKTPRDVILLIDTYLVQHTAKRVLRHQWHTGEMKIARLAAVLGDNHLTDPWMEWLFRRTFVYPLPVAGIGDLMVSGCTREGTEYVASTFYAGGENALPKAAELEEYLRAGGNPKYSLSDPARFPKPLAACYWLMERHVAGLNHIRVGDVTGPDKYYGALFSGLDEASYWGWRWAKDPAFAFLRKHYFGKKDFTDAEWAEIEKAAAGVPRAPWLDMPSRVLPQWASILESGRQHDDYRFRRTVALRAGMGWGHHHNDGLDLQVWMHGVMMTCDGGQRPGYSRPGDRSTRMHNLVEVDGLGPTGGEWLSHNWTRALADVEGAKYAFNESAIPYEHPDVTLYQRQTALLDVDEGQGSETLTPEQCKPGAKLKAGVVTPNSYVFDVVRVAGGNHHTYAFHANLSDAVTHNIINPQPFEQLAGPDAAYIEKMVDERLAGDAPEHLAVTWQLQEKQVKADLGPNHDPARGAHFTRLHVLGEAGARVLRGSLNCRQWNYQIPMAFVQRRGAAEEKKLESVFAAVIEPYVGAPFLREMQRLPVDGNDAGARAAVAVRVQTMNGHDDLCFADTQSERIRSVGRVKVAAEFAYLSRDAEGLRQATLNGGSLLEAAEVVLRPVAAEYRATIRSVDYPSKTLLLDKPFPDLDGRKGVFAFEVGTADHWTCYTADKVSGDRITVRRGADFYLSRIKDLDAANRIVYCGLSFGTGKEGGSFAAPGIDKHWVASNDAATKFWRAEYLAGDRGTARFGFKLDAPVTLADFGEDGIFRLWEYGPGDTVRHRTTVSLQRAAPGVYRIETDVDFEIAVPAKALEVSADGVVWRTLQTTPRDGRAVAKVARKDLADGAAFIRAK